jgi:hypothetical protein
MRGRPLIAGDHYNQDVVMALSAIICGSQEEPDEHDFQLLHAFKKIHDSASVKCFDMTLAQ